MKMLLPLMGRHEIVALPMLAKIIIGCPFFRVFQRGIGFSHFLEPTLGVRLLGYIRMIFVSQTAIGLLDIRLGRIALYTKGFVIIDVFHLHLPVSMSSRVCSIDFNKYFLLHHPRHRRWPATSSQLL